MPGYVGKTSHVSRVDRGLDFLSAELVKFRVGVAGIQETKWFGSDVAHRQLYLRSFWSPNPNRGKTSPTEQGCWNLDESRDVGGVAENSGSP